MEELKDKKVLVTGGAGFIGSHIVDRLVELGAEVIVLDNLITGNIENIKHNLDKIKFIEKDLTDDKALEESLEGVDLISHQAALRSVPKSVESPFEFHEVNVTGTLKLFLKAKEKGVKKIVFASSSSVYGERIDFPEKESDLAQPVSPYAATKLMDEHYGSLFSKLYGVDVISLRYFNVFGPRQSLENKYAVVVPKFIVSLLEGKNPPIYGDGQQERDFSYIDNVVDANILALTKDGIGGEVFNIAGGAPYSVNQLYKFLKELTKKDLEPDYLKPRPGDVRKTCADITKAQKMLDWQPKVDFKEGLEKTVDWFRRSIEL
ncbi:MAG: SDR family oxidoreductase [Candidatus Omnitrophica bacterium]|nr:SDR family oxidoreductase [Candidatus Omnitrophota bacterium]MCF7892945.1 SDR family oxidoreductase [Candidatus Omnitrophota bacterium]